MFKPHAWPFVGHDVVGHDVVGHDFVTIMILLDIILLLGRKITSRSESSFLKLFAMHGADFIWARLSLSALFINLISVTQIVFVEFGTLKNRPSQPLRSGSKNKK